MYKNIVQVKFLIPRILDLAYYFENKGPRLKIDFQVINDDAWLRETFLPTVQKRGGAVLAARKLGSAMSAAKAACDHMKQWFEGTKDGQ